MPLYEYRCRRCSHETEVLQKISDPPLRKCPKCSGRFEKLISRTSFQLKGGGWFNQGYGTGSTKPPGNKPAKPDASKGGKNDKSKKSDGGGKAGAGSGGRSAVA